MHLDEQDPPYASDARDILDEQDELDIEMLGCIKCARFFVWANAWIIWNLGGAASSELAKCTV